MTPAPPWLARLVTKLRFTESGCMVFTGSRSAGSGYGRLRRGPKVIEAEYVHRLMWELLRGPIPDGWRVARTGFCEERACCHPGHHELQ